MHYLCDEQANWWPDLADIKAKITPNTKALVLINPNNPTGAVYPKEVLEGMVELARQHKLVLFSDEIYDKILYDGAVHISTASLAPDVLCLTFNGLSNPIVSPASAPAGWPSPAPNTRPRVISKARYSANMRLCANVPSQHAIQTALGGYQSINDPSCCRVGCSSSATAPELLNDIPGISCVKPMGALYAFPRIDPEDLPDSQRREVRARPAAFREAADCPGTAFNWPWPDHFRVVTLPRVDDLEQAIGRIGNFLKTYQQ